MKVEIDINLIDKLVARGRIVRDLFGLAKLSVGSPEETAIRDLLIVVRELKVVADASREQDDSDDEKQSDADKAAKQCDRILDLCDELPSRAEEFGESVREKVQSIRDCITQNGHVTDAQQEALDNMEAGVERWLR